MRKKPTEIFNSDKVCYYGCGNVARFLTACGHYICDSSSNRCPINRYKNSIALKNAHKTLDSWHEGRCGSSGMASEAWRSNNIEKVKEAYKKSGETHSTRIKQGIIVPSSKGRLVSKETREKMSASANHRNGSYVKVKWFTIFNPYENRDVKVQGTWELKYAIYLNSKNIKWIKVTKSCIKYKNFKEDYDHTYYPDFFLPDSGTYVEIKGFYWKSKDGRVDDKRKMEMVLNQNKDLNIKVLQKEDLILLGIDLKSKVQHIDNSVHKKQIKKSLKRKKAVGTRAYDRQVKREKRIELILNSDIDFKTYGWVSKVAELISMRPQKVSLFMKKYMKDFYQSCYKRLTV